jgi:hypothetical protein
LSLDGGNKRRSLEKGTGQCLESSGKSLLVGEGIVESDDGNVFLSCSLLRLDESCSSVDTDNQTSSNFRVESSRVSSLFNSKDSLHPSDNFVRRGVGRLVEINNAGPKISVHPTFV